MPTKLIAVAAAIALLASALALAACGSKSEDDSGARQPFTVALDWYPNADHAGIFVSKELGYFDDAGLEVSIDSPTDPSLPIKLVAAGKADLAVTYEPEVMLAREQGLDVVSVAALVDRPLTSMIWLKKSKLKGVAGLKGKTVSTAGIPYQDGYLSTILERAKVDPDSVHAVSVGQGLLPSILGGKAAATLGPFWNIEGVQLKLDGDKPVIKPVDRLGVPSYDELVLVAQGKRLREDPDPIRLFLGALSRGTTEAAKRPNFAAKTILDANDDLKPKVTRAQVKATLPLLAHRRKGRPFGFMDPGSWAGFISWMHSNGLIETRPRPSEVLTNEYLPGDVPD